MPRNRSRLARWGVIALAITAGCSDGGAARERDRTEVALAALAIGDRYDREMALTLLADEPPRRARDVRETARRLAALLADPGALHEHRERAAALLVARPEYAVHAVDGARAVLGTDDYRTAALDILRIAGVASRPHAAPVLAIVRDDSAPSAQRALAIDVLDRAELHDATFRAILGELARNADGPALREAARTALEHANARIARAAGR